MRKSASFQKSNSLTGSNNNLGQPTTNTLQQQQPTSQQQQQSHTMAVIPSPPIPPIPDPDYSLSESDGDDDEENSVMLARNTHYNAKNLGDIQSIQQQLPPAETSGASNTRYQSIFVQRI